MDKQWEAERRGSKRAEARLNNGIHEIEEAQNYHMNSMTREQKQLQKDLIRIKQATAKKTSNPRNVKQKIKAETPHLHGTMSGKIGQLPRHDLQDASTRNQPVVSQEKPVMASGSSMTLQMRINDFMDGVRSTKGSSSVKNITEPSLSSTTVADADISAGRRLSISSVTKKTVTEDLPSKQPILNPQFARQRRGSLFKDKPIFDEEIYAPDGSLRTLHTMPDFMDSLEEAKSARYIRHKVKPESEKELSIGEIFQRDTNEDQMSEHLL